MVKLQSGGRACCHYTDGEKLRTALNTADSTLLKQVHTRTHTCCTALNSTYSTFHQVGVCVRARTLFSLCSVCVFQDQMLMDLHLTLQLLKAQLHHKDETLANFKRPFTPATPVTSATPSSCSRRGCGVAMAMVENQPPGKRTLLRFFSPSCSSKMRAKADTTTPYARILRSRQPSPPPSPALVRRGRV